MVSEKGPKVRGRELPDDVKRYIMVELHCDMTSCKPCTFPDCPLLEERKEHESVTRTVELGDADERSRVDGTTVVTEKMKRYLMVELSCDGTACSPCTYPNCQRFSRDLSIGRPKPRSKPKVKRVLSIDRFGRVLKEDDDN